MSFSKEFDGKVALITGGTSGIGKVTALTFAQAGAKVVIAGRRVTEGEQAVQEICARGGDSIFVKTDVSVASEVKALINKTVESYGRLDCAFNNVGNGLNRPLTEHTEDDWDYIINANLKGMWLSLKYELPIMLEQGSGAIVNMSSVGGVVTIMPGMSVYSAAKAGIIGLTRAAAIEYAKSNIRINTISPGAVKTLALENNFTPDQLTFINGLHPLGRIGKPMEVAEAVIWLCSERTSFVTGHNLIIDGGYTAQ
ncbi:MAG: SDR family oxidoreductase [Okeania sp. SIO1H6]|nr:SDR family oxidoreductase [Okeania sp. SIO1H6]